jgi:hypothetical protein
MKLRPRNRKKRCYELAYRYLCEDERYNDGSWILVDGVLTSPATHLLCQRRPRGS